MLTRFMVATAVTAIVLSPLAAQQALAVGTPRMPLEVPGPSVPPSSGSDSMDGMDEGDMPGMDHDQMPGMDHSGHASTAPTSVAGTSSEHAGHPTAQAQPSSESRPTSLVVGAFATVNAGAMGSALVLRRRRRAVRAHHRTGSTK